MHNIYCDYLSCQFLEEDKHKNCCINLRTCTCQKKSYEDSCCLYVNTLMNYVTAEGGRPLGCKHFMKKKKLNTIIKNGISKEFIVATLIEIPREIFVNVEDIDKSLANHSLPLIDGQTISQPSLVGQMIQMLHLTELETKPDVKILEIGTASGYNAVLLSECLNKLDCKNNTVYTIELYSSLVHKAINNILNLHKALPMPEADRYNIKNMGETPNDTELRSASRPGGSGASGDPERNDSAGAPPHRGAESRSDCIVKFETGKGNLVLYKGDGTKSLGFCYNRIIVTAGGDLPLTFIEDLDYNGILVMPVDFPDLEAQYIVRFKKLKELKGDNVSNVDDLKSILNKKDFETKTIIFNGRYSLVINIGIPVTFVPLQSL